MSFLAITGAFIITMSLLMYGIGSIFIQRFGLITKTSIVFLVFGLVFDITATIFMIIGSGNTPFSLHGFIGYSAFLMMLGYVIYVIRLYVKNKGEVIINKKIELFTKIAFGFWLIAYFTGSLIVIWN